MSFEQDSLETSSLEVFQVREVGVCPTVASPSRCLALFQASHSASVEDGLGGLCLGGWTWWLVSFQIADSRDDLRKFDSSRTNPGTSAPLNLRTPVPQKEASPPSSRQTAECSNSKSKTEMGVSSVKSFLPVPRSKVAQCSQNTKRNSSSSNTRQLEINNNSKEENWTLDKHEQVEKPNK